MRDSNPCTFAFRFKTSRDRPKSAPYPRLKNSKKTSKCQVFSFTVLENRKFSENFFSKKLHTQKNGPSSAPGPASANPWRAKVSQWRKTERGDPLGFFNIHSVAKQQKKMKGTLWGKIFRKKVSQSRKKIEKGDPSVSPGMVCYAEKQEKPFWFSSLGQIIQFGTIKFRRTFQNYFGQFVWIEKSHYNSRVSLHEAPTKNTD